MIYLLIVSLHIIFAGIWLANFISDIIIKKKIFSAENFFETKSLVQLYLKFVNVIGIIGSMGILLTGIYLVTTSTYGFFEFSSNHWLVTKQVIFVIILILIFGFVIPTAKKTRSEMSTGNSLEDVKSIKKLFKINMTINLLVTLNLLLALTHKFY